MQAEIDAVELSRGLDLRDHLAGKGLVGFLGDPAGPRAGLGP
jgi:hypothetical protein